MQKELGREVSETEVKNKLIEKMEEVFEAEILTTHQQTYQ
jgi:hypothetical protein